MRKEQLEKKYIDLILSKCIFIDNCKALFIDYTNYLDEFVDSLVMEVKKHGVTDIYLNRCDIEEKRRILESSSIEEIESNSYFNSSIWDEYANKGASFLMFSTIYPHYFDDIDTEKLAKAANIARETKPVYKKKQLDGSLEWSIVVFPNKIWAMDKFPDLNEFDAYDKLFEIMMHAVLVDTENPKEEWDKYVNKQRDIVDKLNNLKITNLYYKNKLGTDLKITLSDKALWQSTGYEFGSNLVNMPSYEVFTSPDKRYTEGIVYATKPLSNSGALIDEFWIKFKDGKVTSFDAKIGKDVLESIINSDQNSAFLGEVALVSKKSVIAKSNFVFDETCLDENASCHIALGAGFLECVVDGIKLSDEEKKKIGLNDSNNHVDFMIGSDDLNIWADTNKGYIQIFKEGDFFLE